MKTILMAGLSTALIGLAVPNAASAQALRIDPAAGLKANSDVTNVQYRRYGGPGRYYGGGRYYRGGGYYGPRYGYRRYNRGAAVGAGIAGLAAGAIIGGAIANSQQPTYYGGGVAAADSSVSYCMQRFKSYDPASGTYLGYDGLRHPCP